MFKNPGLKIASLLFGILLWVQVSINKNYSKIVDVPIGLVNLPENLTLTRPVPSTAKIKVQGEGKSILGIRYLDMRAYLDLKDAKLGRNDFILKRTDIKVPKALDLKVVDILAPKQLVVELDVLFTKSFAIKSKIIVNEAENYSLVGDITLSPESTTVSGARKIILGLKQIFTKEYELNELKRDTSFFAFLDNPKEVGLTFFPRKIKAKLDISKIVRKKLKNIQVRLINIPDKKRYELEPNHITVRIAGPAKVIRKFKRQDFNCYIDYNQFIIEDKTSLNPTISTLKQVEWSNVVPKKLKLVRRR